MNNKTGDIILFFGGEDLIDREIKQYENSMFTHAAIAINDEEIVEGLVGRGTDLHVC